METTESISNYQDFFDMAPLGPIGPTREPDHSCCICGHVRHGWTTENLCYDCMVVVCAVVIHGYEVNEKKLRDLRVLRGTDYTRLDDLRRATIAWKEIVTSAREDVVSWKDKQIEARIPRIEKFIVESVANVLLSSCSSDSCSSDSEGSLVIPRKKYWWLLKAPKLIHSHRMEVCSSYEYGGERLRELLVSAAQKVGVEAKVGKNLDLEIKY